MSRQPERLAGVNRTDGVLGLDGPSTRRRTEPHAALRANLKGSDGLLSSRSEGLNTLQRPASDRLAKVGGPAADHGLSDQTEPGPP